MTESAVMARLDKDGPATTADLARAESMKPQSMGATIAALEEMGVVARKCENCGFSMKADRIASFRKPHPTDGRQMNIELTAKGEATWECLLVETPGRTREAKRYALLLQDVDVMRHAHLLFHGQAVPPRFEFIGDDHFDHELSIA